MARRVIQSQPMIMVTRSSKTASPTPEYSRRYRRVSFAWFIPVTTNRHGRLLACCVLFPLLSCYCAHDVQHNKEKQGRNKDEDTHSPPQGDRAWIDLAIWRDRFDGNSDRQEHSN